MFENFTSVLGLFISAFQATWFIAVPVAFYILFKMLWLGHISGKFFSQGENIVLELRPPRDIEKSPQLMENFFNLLAGTDKGKTIIEQMIIGYNNPFFSIEIVGDSGTVHFYIRAQRQYRELIESGLYAQYPGIEIMEVQDYVERAPKIVPNTSWKIWGTDFELVKPDAYPIKSYRKFEEDITGKMIDPLHTLIENMSSLGPGQKIWLQYIITAEGAGWNESVGRKEVDKVLGKETQEGSRLWKDIKDVFFGIFTGWFRAPEFSPWESGAKDQDPVEFRLTPGQKDTLKGLEENLGKPFFDVKMRGIVVGRAEGYTPVNINALMGSVVKAFSDSNHNGFRPESLSKTGADYAFKDAVTKRKGRRIYERYRDRDPSGVMFHLSSEELATLFHMPDMSVVAPGVQYVDSRRGSAPTNLPFM